MKIIPKLLACLLLVISLNAQVYHEENGILILEPESTTSPLGLWIIEDTLTGTTGDGYLRFTGNTIFNGPPGSPLEYQFQINQGGLYYLHLHCAKITHVIDGETRTDLSNDCYIRIEGDYGAGPNPGNSHGMDAPLSMLKSDTKFYGGSTNRLSWASGNRLDPGGDTNKRVAIYDFKAGETYKMVVSGRSKDYRLNRMVLRHSSVTGATAQNLNLSPSSLVQEENEASSFVLINSTTDQPIRTLEDGDIIDLAEDGSALNIQFAPNITIGSAAFSLTGQESRQINENAAPYSLFADQDGDYADWNPTLGEYTLAANGYAESGAIGTILMAQLINFSVIDSSLSGDGTVTVGGELKRWHKATLDLHGPPSSELATLNPFLDYRFNVLFTGPSNQEFLVPGYFAGNGNGGESGNVWRAHLNPDEVGTWSYQISFRQGSEISVDLSPSAGSAFAQFDGLSGNFLVAESDKSGDDFRSPDKGMLVNRGHRYLTYGGSGKPFLYTGPGIPENILGFRGFTNTEVGIGHEFSAHLQDWNHGDPDWDGGAGRPLIGAFNYLADQGGNCLYMMSNTIDGDGLDVFMHPTPKTTRSRYDNLKLDQWDIALSHAQSKGIFLHWHLAEVETGNRTYYGSTAIPTLRKLYFRMLVARFGYYNAVKWNLSEETKWTEDARREQMAYLKAIDPYNHPVTFQLGGIGLPTNEFSLHLGETDLDGASLQGNPSDNQMWDSVNGFIEDSLASGVPWTVSWDEPQKIENNDRADRGYPHGREAKMWPCLMAGGDGFMWYVQKDGGGHGFDQSIADFTIMQSALNWSEAARDFLDPLPLLEMESTRSGLNEGLSISTGNAYMLFKTNEVYAIYQQFGSSQPRLDLTNASGNFKVTWFNPRDGGYSEGTVGSVSGGGIANLGSPTSDASNDWAVLVERQATQIKSAAYIYGDVSNDGNIPSGSAAPYDQMLLTDTGRTGLSLFQTMVESAGFQISQHYDQETTLNDSFLNQFDIIIFGLHQKIWSSTEKEVLDRWLSAGGGMLIYSDAAAGGQYNLVGINNNVGQNAANNLISQYGMEVLVDQGGGVAAFRAGPGATHPIAEGQVVLEGEGVSPVAIDPTNPNVERLIPYESNDINRVSGGVFTNQRQGLTIANPQFAALALARVGAGNIIAMFDRQPMWNNGIGSDIEKRDNLEILRRTMLFLGSDQPVGETSYAINCGSSAAYTAADGTQYTADEFFEGGGVYLVEDQISGTSDAPLYRSERWGSFRYNLPVPDGDYDVTLKLAEIYFEGNGSRVFSATAEGYIIPTLTNLDLYSEVGHDRIYDVTFQTSVVDGVLNLEFDATVNNAKCSAILVKPSAPIPSEVVVAINFGGPAYTSTDGIEYLADDGRSPNVYQATEPISGTEDDVLYQSEGWAQNLGYDIALPNGSYMVTLKFAEIYNPTGVGTRVFSGTVEGELIFNELDLVATYGHDVAYDVTFETSVVDGVLNIEFDATVDSAKCSAILVESSAPIPSEVVAAINFGGPAYTSTDGVEYSADGGRSPNIYQSTEPISGTEDDILYQSEGWGQNLGYDIALSNGSYLVTLKFAEIYNPTGVGMRVFSGTIEGEPIFNELDLVATYGHDVAYDVSIVVQISDGILDLDFSASAGNTKCSAVVVNQMVPSGGVALESLSLDHTHGYDADLPTLQFDSDLTDLSNNEIGFTHANFGIGAMEYEWSTDLITWYRADGVDGPEGGVSVSTSTVDSLSKGVVVTMSASGKTSCMFVRVKVP